MKTLLVCVMLAIFAVPAIAETYTWVDSQGTINYTEDLGNVPKKYRKKVRVLGEQEPATPEVQEGKEKPDVQQQKEVPPGGAVQKGQESAPAVKQEKKAEYGGKDATTWKYDFAAARANLKAAENHLADNRNRLKDTTGMSREEYLSIENTIRSLEYSILSQRKRLDDLKIEAGNAGVPAELMQ